MHITTIVNRAIYDRIEYANSTDNYIKCRIPYDEKILDMSKKNVGTNVGINKTEKAVLGILISNPEKTAEESSLPI